MDRRSVLTGLLGAMTSCVLAPSPRTEGPGAELLHSRDGGKSWRAIRIPFKDIHRMAFCFVVNKRPPYSLLPAREITVDAASRHL